VERAEFVRQHCQRERKFIVFGEVNKEMKESVPVFLWRHVELFTNHIDRVCEYVGKQVASNSGRVEAQQHFVMFYGQRGS